VVVNVQQCSLLHGMPYLQNDILIDNIKGYDRLKFTEIYTPTWNAGYATAYHLVLSARKYACYVIFGIKLLKPSNNTAVYISIFSAKLQRDYDTSISKGYIDNRYIEASLRGGRLSCEPLKLSLHDVW